MRFSKKTTGKKLVRVEVDGHALAWCYQDANKVEGVVVESEVSDDPLVLTNVRSSVVYPGAFDNADLEYLLQPGSLKENIILQNADAASVYTLEYKYNSLTAVQVDEHTVEFQDSDGAVVYVLYAPYMTDANGATSAALTLEITKNKKNSCTIEMAADEDWLQDEARVYPVTLDPLLMTSQAWSDEDCCQSCFISSANPDTSYGRGGTEYLGSMYAGYYSAYGKMRTLIKVATLPSIGVGDKVVHAELAAYVRYCYPSNTVSAYRVTTDWTQSTATWNSNITFQAIFRDYQIIPSIERTETDVNRWETFDITDLVRGWYSGDYPNYGIMLRSNRESSTTGAHVQFYSSGLSNNSTVRPMLAIYYRNMTGYEDYWSYTSVAAGRDGSASVNNYNGNFTFTQPITLDAGGTLMPVSISAVYNSTAAAASYSSLGLGFQTNYHIYVKENPSLDANSTDEEKKYKYYFNDADGTDHYFYFENLTDTTAKDEDGLGYTLTVNSSSTSARYTITDKTGNKMVFNSTGKLVKIQNTDGVTNVVAYDSSGRISTITDGAGRIYTFAYTDTTAASTIKSITDPAGRATTFTYSSGRLTRFTFPDSNCVYMSYYSTGLLYHIRGVDTTRHTFVGYKDSAAKPIDYIKIGNANDTLEKYTFKYYQNETTITELQGRSYTYQFNDFGQTTGIVSNTDGRAVFMEYYAPTGKTDSKTNKVLSASRSQYTTQNYLANPTFADGTTGYTLDATATSYSRTRTTTYGRNDNTSMSLTSSSTGKNFVMQYVDLEPGVYTASVYYSTNGGTLSASPTVAVDVRNGSTLEVTYNAPESVVTTAAGEWIRSSVTFEITESRNICFFAGLHNCTGTIYIDDFQLEEGYSESTFNLLENNGFSNGTTGWTITNGGTGTMSEMGGFTGYSYLTGVYQKQHSISQTVSISGAKGDVYSFGAWVKANSIPTGGDHHIDDPDPQFQVKLTYYNGSTEVGSETINANSDVYSWQFVSAESIAPAAYTSIKFSLVYDYNLNKAYMTGAYCYKEQYGQTYTYDDDGNIVSAVDLAETESTFEYGTNNMLTKLVNPSGSSYEYTYNAKNQLTQAVSSDGQTYDFTYDSKGNVLTSTISAEGSDLTITSSATYTDDQNFLASLIDQRGYTTSYSYDTTKGTLLTTTDPRSTVTTYAYNALNNQLTSVSAGGQTVSYTYSNDRLSTIGVNGDTTYTFAYDNFGRNTGISVGSTALATYTYTDNLLTQQTYANGATLNFAYDSLDRLTSRWYNNASYKLEYLYGSNGELASVLDYAAATRTKYVYDLADRVVSTRTYNTTSLTGQTLLDSVDYTYADETNYLTGVTHYNAALGTQNVTYVYGDVEQGQMPDQVYQVNWNGTELLTNDYDAFGRLIGRSIALTDSALAADTLFSHYTYEDNADGTTTTTLVKRHATNHTHFRYYYDEIGNITRIYDTRKFVDYAYYTYDALNQLVREDNKAGGYTCVYTYENGNITSKATYAYTREETLGTPQKTETWTYGDTTWGDLLTAYNDGTSSYTVTSDASGNITSISNGTDSVTHTWLGRILQKAVVVKDGTTTTANYSYNADGQRIKKVVGSTTTKYYYNGDILAGMTIGSNKLIFMYDENGSPFGFTYNGTAYYYVKNLQGDVIAITNASGTVVVEYAYDAWGKLLSVTGDAASTIGQYNPIRYRGYVYDAETGYYYLNSRYYDPELCRFISADNQLDTDDVLGMNLFAYCGNNPVMRIDPNGEAWYHWAIGAAIVVACAMATVATCGGFAAAATAIGMVSCGMAATTTAATVTAAALIGSATVFAVAAVDAAVSSSSVQEFCDKGNWGTVAATAIGAAAGGSSGYLSSKPTSAQSGGSISGQSQGQHTSGVGSPKNNINPGGSYTKLDNGGNIYSYTQFDLAGRQTLRIDFQGRPHAGILPHIHLYTYPAQGGRIEYVFDFSWHLID